MAIGQTVLNTLRGQVEPNCSTDHSNGALRPHPMQYIWQRDRNVVLRNEISKQEVSAFLPLLRIAYRCAEIWVLFIIQGSGIREKHCERSKYQNNTVSLYNGKMDHISFYTIGREMIACSYRPIRQCLKVDIPAMLPTESLILISANSISPCKKTLRHSILVNGIHPVTEQF